MGLASCPNLTDVLSSSISWIFLHWFKKPTTPEQNKVSLALAQSHLNVHTVKSVASYVIGIAT